MLDPRGPYHRPLDVLVLGIAQDGGHPQAGCVRPCCTGPAAHRVCSLAVLDRAARRWWLVDASPDLPSQLRQVHALGLPMLPEAILLTHAHIGHYAGLFHLGREVMGAHGVPVYALPRMAAFLRRHGPWEQLVRLGNIVLHEVSAGETLPLGPLRATPILVPHRGEYSETAAWELAGPPHAQGVRPGGALYLPDLDHWGPGTEALEERLPDYGAVYLDGTFFDDPALPGRDAAEVPHPPMRASMVRLGRRGAAVRFLHLNHSNPALDPASKAASEVRDRGFVVAEEGELRPLG